MNEIYGEVEYIHPYGRGFMIYTDKPWEKGTIKLSNGLMMISGREIIRVPLSRIMSIDKSIKLPNTGGERALLLIEYFDIAEKANVYLLISASESFIRKLRIEVLSAIVSSEKVMYRIGEKWYPGRISYQAGTVIITGEHSIALHPSRILKIERKKIEYGFRKVGVILIKYDENKELALFIAPLKRMFLWQLLYQVIEDYINKNVVEEMRGVDRLVLNLIADGWKYEDIMAKLEISAEEMERIVNRLAKYNLIKRIIILELTERGKKVIRTLTDES